MNTPTSLWNTKSIELSPYNLTLKGYSLASRKTGFLIPELSVFFDAGLQSPYNPKFVFVTHCHSDHCFALPMLLTNINTRPLIYVPKESEQLFVDFLHGCFRLFMHDTDYVYGYQYGEMLGIQPNKTTYISQHYAIKTVKCCHSVPCLGFGLNQIKNKLKNEYRSCTKKELLEIKNANIPIHDEVFQPIIMYLGDTNIDVFKENEEEIFKYLYIVVECTFLFDEHLSVAIASRHMHWLHLEPIIDSHPDVQFILIHFSPRYSSLDLTVFFKTHSKNNIHTFL